MLTTMLHHPRKLWLRRALFQVHLWVGVALALYMVAISVSGALLVFQDEIRLATLRHTPLDTAHVARVSTVVAETERRFPERKLTFVSYPREGSPWWTLYVEDARGRLDQVYADAATGRALETKGRLFIDWVLDLHVYLLAGQTGFIANCLMGMGLLVLAATGAVLWWPGVKLWRRALGVGWRRGWRRVNFDLHNAIGIWTLGIVAWWGVTAVYFLLPQQVSALVNAVSPLKGMKPPVAAKAAEAGAAMELEAVLAGVAAGPGTLSSVGLPEKPGGAVTAYVDRGTPGDFSHRDIVTLDGRTGRALAVWHYGENRSAGDWFLWLMHPLHFGTLWGLGVKVLWAGLGLGVAVLSGTGLLMYWNRKLRFVVARLAEKPKA